MEIDLDVSGLLNPEKMIAACEAEDELGCVLCLHLAFERLVEVYIKHTASPEQIKFIEKTNEFGEKLKRAVLLGLPLSVARLGNSWDRFETKWRMSRIQ